MTERVALALAAAALLLLGCDREPPPAAPASTPSVADAATAAPGAADAEGGLTAEARCEAGQADACEAYGDALIREDPPALAAAAEVYRVGCDGGDAASCTALGRLTQDGRGVPRDPDAALRLHQRACEAGHGSGCLNAALMLNGGIGVDIDLEAAEAAIQRARERFEADCEAGRWAYCLNLSVILESGFGLVDIDREAAAEVYERACAGGSPDACLNVGLLEGGPEGMERIGAVCEEDESSAACGAYGSHLVVQGDAARGVALLESSCDAGIPNACGALAAHLSTGDVLPAEPERARRLQRRACELGSSSACFVLGLEILEKPDQRHLAVEPLTLACHMGNGEACATLGLLVMQGEAVEADPGYALLLFKHACRMGYPGACVELIERSEPIPLPPARRGYILEGACKRGIQNACTLLDFERDGADAPASP